MLEFILEWDCQSAETLLFTVPFGNQLNYNLTISTTFAQLRIEMQFKIIFLKTVKFYKTRQM